MPTTGVETLCELCAETFPHPVTYHMRQCHSGCGQHAGGKGYNSSGNYCLGWAGNCGDGGVRKCYITLKKYLKNEGPFMNNIAVSLRLCQLVASR